MTLSKMRKGAAVDVVADEDVIAGLEREENGRGGRASAAERDAMLAALERREATLERGTRGVARARSNRKPLCTPGPSCAKVLASTIGVMTAPETGSGS